MSYQADRYYSVFSAAAAEADAEVRTYLTGKVNWRKDVNPKGSVVQGFTCDRAGIESLISEGRDAFNKEVNNGGTILDWSARKMLPWNIHKEHSLCSEWNGGTLYEVGYAPQRKWEISSGEGQAALEGAARLSGFLKAAPTFKTLTGAILRGSSNRGCNSPATTIRFSMLMGNWRSPGQADRHLWKVRRRANQILAPLGRKASWKSLALLLDKGPGKVGKDALIVAAWSLGMDTYSNTRKEALSFLVDGKDRW